MNIIYEDSDILICHKMPGVPVQTAKVGQPDMVSMLRSHLAEKGADSRIFLVHRLDQPVEGVIAFARTPQAAASLSRQLQEKQLTKQYLAVAEGIFPEKAGILEDYLLRDGRSNTSKAVPPHQKGAKFARLSYEVLKEITEPTELAALYPQANPVSYLRILLETGRHHQIRVQMAHAGHPLAGDKKYNKNCPLGYLPIGLCSVQISFRHPRTGKQLSFATKPQGALFSLLPAHKTIDAN